MKTKTLKQAKDQNITHPYIGVVGYIGEKMVEFSEKILTGLKGKKKAAIIIILVATGINVAQAQTAGIYLAGESKHEVVLKTTTGQYGDPAEQAKTKTEKKGQHAAVINSPVAHNIIGEDKYLKTKEANKNYSEFQVFDIKGLNKDQVVLGMLTNTLDRATRYNEQGYEQKAEITTAYIDQIDDKGQVIKGSGKVQVSTYRFKDKVFIIIGNNDYRYIDGTKLVGDQKVVNELMKGKPITEVTFFYELQKAGIVNKNMRPTQFADLTINEKQRLLNRGIMAGNL